jgi:hypothetical protein
MKSLYKQLRRSLRHRYADFQSRFLHDFVFIHINKTGGTSIEKALGAKFDHRTALEKRAAIGERAWARKFTFTVVRNPWDKVVSHYHYRVQTQQAGFAGTPPPFPEWVRRAYGERDPRFHDQPLMFLPQMDWIADGEDRVLVEFVGRFERLEQDFQHICQRLGRQASLPHLKPSRHGHYRDYYDDEARGIVAERFARDIRALGYAY